MQITRCTVVSILAIKYREQYFVFGKLLPDAAPNCTVLIMVDQHRIPVIIAKLFFSLLSIFGNSLVIISCLKFDYLKQRSFVFVGFLATADLLLGIGNPTDVVLELVKPSITNDTLPYWNGACKTTQFMKLLGGYGDLSAIFGISMERFVFIRYALTHDQILTKKRAIIIAFLMGAFSLLSSLVLIIFSKDFELGMPCQVEMIISPLLNYALNFPVFIVVFPTAALFYYKIARIAYSMVRRTNDSSQSAPTNQTTEQSNQSANWKITKLLCVVIGVFVITYIPYQ